ncbi:hypothetical protein KIK06_22380 [Nocardiopsis sp. EMB25]|uniref:anti-sigma factor family protein n=1 Tax=Nocardiopsis sp. EMB25 TaxID=2835867 RepID=UPI0022840728|nr:hypothetical protein [Nocardiopsis sp. EMB25]MCY9786637.1 hypothetical protein [Nocardiopsis sp. EMB25]
MTPHPDAEALAFLAEDLLDPSEERTVTAHIETCPTCAATLDELTGVSRVLAATPVPELPQDVADLLDQRIADAARERAERGPVTEPTDPVPAKAPSADATVVPLATARRRRSSSGMPRLLVAAAAAVFVVGGGVAVVNGVLSNGNGSVESATPFMESEDGVGEPDTALTYAPELVRSETVYTDAALDAQAARTLERSTVADDAGAAGGQTLLEEQSVTDAVERCSDLVEEEFDTQVTLVDDAFYGDGAEPAWVLYAPRGDQFDVFVVDPRCARSADAEPGILDRTTVDAP